MTNSGQNVSHAIAAYILEGGLVTRTQECVFGFSLCRLHSGYLPGKGLGGADEQGCMAC